MNIYKVNRTDNWSYDDYDSLIVYANNEKEARTVHPSGYLYSDSGYWYQLDKDGNVFKANHIFSWIAADGVADLEIELVGATDKDVKAGVILGSFNAG